MPGVGDLEIGAHAFHGWRQRQRQRHDADLGIARLNELCRLRNVLAEDELAADRVVQTLMPQRGDGRTAVGRVVGIGDGDASDAQTGQGAEAPTHVDTRIVSGPQHNTTGGVFDDAPRIGEAAALQTPRVIAVGRQKDVEGRAVLDLREEVSGGAERQGDFLPGFLLELRGNRRQHRLQVGRSGNPHGLGRRRHDGRHDDRQERPEKASLKTRLCGRPRRSRRHAPHSG